MENRVAIVRRLRRTAVRMRKHLLKMAVETGEGSSHIGGGLSMIEITATLYGAIIRFDKNDPKWSERDRFILSKGHGVLGYYTALAEAGLIDEIDLLQFEKDGGYLFGHPVKNRSKGIEFSNGSLGMGLSLGIGVALAAKRRMSDYKVYVLMGDGECNEGSVWEAAMAGPQYRLDNLIGIVDRNGFQQTGSNREIMDVGDLGSKWRSFGWNVYEVDGHDIGKLYDVFSKPALVNTPTMIIANTTKGKGLSFTENDNSWHHSPLSKSQYKLAIEELEES